MMRIFLAHSRWRLSLWGAQTRSGTYERNIVANPRASPAAGTSVGSRGLAPRFTSVAWIGSGSMPT